MIHCRVLPDCKWKSITFCGCVSPATDARMSYLRDFIGAAWLLIIISSVPLTLWTIHYYLFGRKCWRCGDPLGPGDQSESRSGLLLLKCRRCGFKSVNIH